MSLLLISLRQPVVCWKHSISFKSWVSLDGSAWLRERTRKYYLCCVFSSTAYICIAMWVTGHFAAVNFEATQVSFHETASLLGHHHLLDYFKNYGSPKYPGL